MKRNVFACFTFVLMCALCAGGCIATKVHTLPVQNFNTSYDNAWNAVVTYLGRDKEPVIAADKEKGVISTDWVIMEKFFATKRYRYDIYLTKLDENNVRVSILSPQQEYDMGDWEDMLPTERRSDRIFRYLSGSAGCAGAAQGNLQGNMVNCKIAKRPFNKKSRTVSRGEK